MMKTPAIPETDNAEVETTHSEQKRLPSEAAVLHEKIRAEGLKELGRDGNALLLSAIAAGLSMGTSMLAKAILEAKLPENDFGFLIQNLGYTVGFLIVILARQQLFTENTITAVLPVMTEPNKRNFYKLLRLWGIVLFGNLLGTAIAALAFLYLPISDAKVVSSFAELGTEVIHNSPGQMITKGIMSGFLVATMVWILANAENSRVTVICIITYLIAIGDFTHIIVGSAEIFYLVFLGDISWQTYLYPFALPTLFGNIIGGTFIFTLLAHVQIRNDMHDNPPL
jgi:formate/nitrite transporter FocA (FNT family)